jgi:Sec-independent protein translocase protein TatA
MTMSGWEMFWILVAALIVVGILMNLRELLRYLRIRSM